MCSISGAIGRLLIQTNKVLGAARPLFYFPSSWGAKRGLPLFSPFCVCFGLYVGFKGATRPLDFVLCSYSGAITPRPISLVAQRNGGKKRTRSRAARGFVKLALRVLRGVVLVGTFLKRILLVRTEVRLVAFFKLLVEVKMLLLFFALLLCCGCVGYNY